MKSNEIWPQLELARDTAGQHPNGNVSGWVLRQLSPEPSCPLNVAVELATGRRAILLRIDASDVPSKRQWPECLGLEIFATKDGAQQVLFGVALKHPQHEEVFSVLADDLIDRISIATSASGRLAALLNGISSWQKFLRVAREPMSIEEQRGLWGELHVLTSHLLPTLGAEATVNAWNASEAAHQDFQFAAGAVEVKTTAAKQPQSIRITSERQLDDTGVGALFLHVVVVDERAVTENESTRGKSLTSLIEHTRSLLADAGTALASLNDRLLSRGWLDAFASRYEGYRWAVRKEHTFRVQAGFPRIVEEGLEAGVGDVNFAVSLAACEPFSSNVSIMTGCMQQSAEPRLT
jgi:hypothetical protein